MKKLNRLMTWPLVLLFLMCTSALAADVPSPDTDLPGWLSALLTAITHKEWTPAVGLVLMGLTYVFREFLGGWVPWFKTTLGGIVLAFMLSLGGTLGIAWASHVTVDVALIFNALTNSAAAGAFWEWLKKRFAPAPEPTPDITTARVS